MTKREHIYYILENYNMRDDAKDIHPDHVKFALSKSWNNLLYDTFRKNSDSLNFYTKEYTSQSAVLNATTNKYEITLPAPILQLPDTSLREGVRSLTVDAWEDIEFVPQSEQENMLLYNLDVYNVDDVISYDVRFDKIIFGQEGTDVDLTTYDFRLSLVIPFSEYNDTDELPVPSGKDMEFQNLTMQFLMQMDPKLIENG